MPETRNKMLTEKETGVRWYSGAESAMRATHFQLPS